MTYTKNTKGFSYIRPASNAYSLARTAYNVGRHLYDRYKKKPSDYVKKKVVPRVKTVSSNRRTSYEHSGTAQPALYFKHGKKPYINKKFISKVRSALTSTDSHQFLSTMCKTSGIGDCTYSISPVILEPDHVSAIQANIGASNATKKFTIRNANLSTSLTNQSSGVVCLRVYECMFRTDCPYSSGNPDPLSMLLNGFTNAALATNSTNIAGTAFQSPAFTSWIKIIAVRQVELNAGETKHITIRNNASKLVNLEKYSIAGSAYSLMGFGKYSKFLLFQQWGQTVNDSTSTTVVSTDRTKLDFVFTVKYDYTWMDDYTNTIYTTGSLGAVNTAQYINELTGGTVTDTQA